MQKHKILSENLVLNTHIGTVLDYEVQHPITQKVKTYTVSLLPDWVNVIAETVDHKIVLVEQWRAGIDNMSIEIPGGKIDEGEGPIDAGLRELEEETGYAKTDKSKVLYLGSVFTNPAIQTNSMHYVFVTNVEKKKSTNFDEFELVYTHVYDKQKVSSLLKEGKISHAYSVIGLMKTLGS